MMRYVYIPLLCILSTLTHAMIPYVDPQQGENLWQMTSRIGDAIDYLLDNTSTTTSDCCLSLSTTLNDIYALTQDIDTTVNNVYVLEQSMSTTLDNLYTIASECCSCDIFLSQADIPITITQPGNYCAIEDLSGFATLITILSNDVVLDLRGYTVSTPVGDAIWITGGSEQITIKNGFVTAPLGYGVNLDEPGKQITIQDMNAYECIYGFYIFSGSTDVRFIGCTARECDYGFFDESEVPYLHMYENCSAYSNTNAGFYIAHEGPASLSRCTADQNNFGFIISFTQILALNNCSAFQNNNSGFLLSAINNGTLTQCSAVRNGSALDATTGSGFSMVGNINLSCISCIALDNYGYGFNSENDANAQLFNNFSKHNTTNGGLNYGILPTNGIVITSTDLFANYVASWWTNVDGGN